MSDNSLNVTQTPATVKREATHMPGIGPFDTKNIGHDSVCRVVGSYEWKYSDGEHVLCWLVQCDDNIVRPIAMHWLEIVNWEVE